MEWAEGETTKHTKMQAGRRVMAQGDETGGVNQFTPRAARFVRAPKASAPVPAIPAGKSY
jgi:hypothetical protein